MEGETDLKWLMDWRTASSNSIGPGMRRVGCSGCDDMVVEAVEDLLTGVCGRRDVSTVSGRRSVL